MSTLIRPMHVSSTEQPENAHRRFCTHRGTASQIFHRKEFRSLSSGSISYFGLGRLRTSPINRTPTMDAPKV